MRYRRLGKSSLVVSALGLGCMGMSQSYGTPDDAESLATINHAIDRGITMLDTADMYGGGTNEELLSQVLGKRRNEVVLATKFGNMRQPDGRFLGVNGSPEYVQQACEASLKRLKISTIDLFYLHRVDTGVPIEDTVGAMARLIDQGKVRYLGLSEAGAKTIRRAHATYPIAALQSEYSLWTRDPEGAIFQACRELGVCFVAFSPVGRGFLAGAISQPAFAASDFRRNVPRLVGDNFQRNLRLVEKIQQLAAEKRCTPAQLALAWVIAQDDFIFAIPGTRRRNHLEENWRAQQVRLTPADLARIREDLPELAIAGERYTPEVMARVDRS